MQQHDILYSNLLPNNHHMDLHMVVEWMVERVCRSKSKCNLNLQPIEPLTQTPFESPFVEMQSRNYAQTACQVVSDLKLNLEHDAHSFCPKTTGNVLILTFSVILSSGPKSALFLRVALIKAGVIRAHKVYIDYFVFSRLSFYIKFVL